MFKNAKNQEKHIAFAVLGGSGLYSMPKFELEKEVTIATPFGMPSDSVKVGLLNGVRIAFLPRHGKGHTLTPSEVPYAANAWALHSLGVQFVFSVSAVGSLREEMSPGNFVIPDQAIDRTVRPQRSFFGAGAVGHFSFAQPFCNVFRELLIASCAALPAVVAHHSACYICIEGPTFSTKAESELYRSWKADIIGMTNLPEARLFREAQMSYATLALVTDYDCWRGENEEVDVVSVLAVLKANIKNAQAVIWAMTDQFLAGSFPEQSPYANAAQYAIMTDKNHIPKLTKAKLSELYKEQLG